MKHALAFAALLGGVPALAAPEPGPAYGEGMVLQRGEPIVINGTAVPGETVRAALDDAVVSARAGEDGSFIVTFPAREANETGATLTLSDSTGETVLHDLLIGDVFLCMGQSNMELPVTRALDAGNQLRRAADDGIRLLKIPQATASVPQADFSEPVAWRPATAESVADFSAACFYMAKQLRADREGVPVGLIHSNWGGSAARAWLSPESVRVLNGDEALSLLRLYEDDPLAATRTFIPRWYDWWQAGDEGRQPWTDSDMLHWKPIPQFSFWNEWEGTGLDTDPVANVWLRQTFSLTAEEAAAGGDLAIGAIDDLDLTWVNGQPVGYTFGWGAERTYRVPSDALRAGENEVLIAANNAWDNGGFFAGPDRLSFTPAGGDAIPLGADWEYSIGAVDGVPPRAPWDSNAGLGVMYNAMIAPLGPMRVASAAWYQGEGDVGQPDYDVKLRELFAGWRRQFGDQTQMLVVQLANFGERQSEPAESGWAQLRQEQLAGVLADRNAVLVTAIDIGEPTDIHPANKNVLGRRIAAAVQGQPMPVPASASREGDRIIVRFNGVEGDLRAYGGPAPVGVEVCGSEAGSCRWADAAVDGQALVIDVAPAEEITRVRHAWADAPVVNTYDARDLPLPGFEVELGD